MTTSAMTHLWVSRECNMAIPIFPLRKRVLLPSEYLILNLYEDRYLQLAEQFLLPPCTTTTTKTTTPPPPPLDMTNDDDHRPLLDGCTCTNKYLIGVVPSTEKPHLIPKGIGPIVPIFDMGDVGVVCTVTSASESQIPTVDGGSIRRIRLQCMAWCRMELTEIVSRGITAPPSSSSSSLSSRTRRITTPTTEDHQSSSQLLPFITAKYRLLISHHPSPTAFAFDAGVAAAAALRRIVNDDNSKLEGFQSLLANLDSSTSRNNTTTMGGDCGDENQVLILHQLVNFVEYLKKESSLLSRRDRIRLLREGLASKHN